MTHQLHQGHNAEVLKQYPDSHFDSIITDPPYGIEFLGKDWDSHTGAVETWRECLRVLKPGGHLLAFSAARTYHHLATNIESVGFEIRDQLMWIYSSGFPKAQDIGKAIQKRQGVEKTETRPGYSSFHKENYGLYNDGKKAEYEKDLQVTKITSPEALRWAGWKTALKPGHEPIVMARKPFRGSTLDNVLQHGVGALNIDATRINFENQLDKNSSMGFGHKNVDRTGAPEFQKDYDEYVFAAPGTQAKQKNLPTKFQPNEQGRYPSNVLGDIPDYQKYFYCPKVSRRERHAGFEDPGPRHPGADGGGYQVHNVNDEVNKKKDPLSHIPTNSDGMMSRDAKGQLVNNYTANKSAVGNNHPTVKPVSLMRYLIQLVTPAGSRVLDPFMGSGSTGMAAVELGHQFVGIDLDANYVSIADRRILGWCAKNPIETKIKTEPPMVAVTKPHSAFDRLFE